MGVGQSEVEIAGLADATIVVLVPESGDDIQVMKAGLMEIADIFVVNKCDRPGADLFIKTSWPGQAPKVYPFKNCRQHKDGVDALFEAIIRHLQLAHTSEKRYLLLAQRVYHIIRDKRMKDVNMEKLVEEVKSSYAAQQFNL